MTSSLHNVGRPPVKKPMCTYTVRLPANLVNAIDSVPNFCRSSFIRLAVEELLIRYGITILPDP